MKILTINIDGIPDSDNREMHRATVFQDYDVIVVDPRSVYRLYYNDVKYESPPWLTTVSGRMIRGFNFRRYAEIRGALHLGATVVCLVRPLEINGFRDGNEQPFVTNYDWLFTINDMVAELGDLTPSDGKTISWIDSSNPLAEYLTEVHGWSAYFNIESIKQGAWKILASAFGTHALALIKQVESGNIILLPSDYYSKNGALLAQCIRDLKIEKTEPPEWLKSHLVSGQADLLAGIEAIERSASELAAKRKELETKNQEFEHWKWLLYEKGVDRLQRVVGDVFRLLGCEVEPTKDVDSDGKIICKVNGDALLEVEGKKDAIKIEKISQLVKNQVDYAKVHQNSIKGILVGNPFCEEAVENRPPKDSQKSNFTREVTKFAERHDISVIWTVDLFKIVCRLLDEKIDGTEKAKIRASALCEIYEGKGLVKFSML